MSNAYTRIVVVIVAIIVAAAAVASANMQRTLGQQTSPVADSIIMKANFKPDTSIYLVGHKCTGYCYYQVSTLQMNAVYEESYNLLIGGYKAEFTLSVK